MVRDLLKVLVLCTLLRTGSPLLCYVCDAEEDPSCADPSSNLYLRFRYLAKCKSFVDESGRAIGRPLCYRTGPPGSVKRGCLSADPMACLEQPCYVCDYNCCNGSAPRGYARLSLCAMLPAIAWLWHRCL